MYNVANQEEYLAKRAENIANLNKLAAFISSFEDAAGVAKETTTESLRLRGRLLDEECTELCKELQIARMHLTSDGLRPNWAAVAKEMADLIITVFSAARGLNINIGYTLQEVIESNLSKRTDDGTFLRDTGGKILKGPNYIAPQLKAEEVLHGSN